MIPKLPKLHILIISEVPNASNSIFRFIFEGLHNQGAIQFKYFFRNESSLPEIFQAIQWADSIFFFGTFAPPSLALLRFSKRLGKVTIFSLDIDYRTTDRKQNFPDNEYSPETIGSLRKMFQESDLVWLFSEEMIKRYHHLSSRIILGKLPGSLEIFPNKGKIAPEHETINIIGCVTGSFHPGNFQILVNPLFKLFQIYGSSLQVEFVGFTPEQLLGHPQVNSIPYFKNIFDYYTYLNQAKWTIGLSLLEDTYFNRSKTNSIYRDYASFGISAIYSDMPVFSSCIKHRVNGYLTPHTEEDILKAIQTMLADRTLRQRIQKEALKDVSCNYSLKAAQLQLLREMSKLQINRIRNSIKKPKLLIVGYDQVSTTHIDALQPCRELEKKGLIDFTWREPGGVSNRDIEMVNAVYLVRAFEEVNRDLLKGSKKELKPFICSWDDNFFLLPEETPLGQLFAQTDTLRIMRKFLRQCSLIMASTPPLASFSRNFNTEVMEAMYGLRPPELLYENSQDQKASPDKIRIGFFGVNFEIDSPFIFNSLKEIRKRYRNKIFIEMIGPRPSKELLVLLDSFFDIIADYDSALTFLKSRRWHIGLAPLADTPFNEARQATKFRDYAWCGAAIIASDVPTYRRTFLNGIQGLLVKNESSAWTEAITTLIEDSEKREFMVNGAKQLLKNLHMQDETIASWYQLVWRIMKFEFNKSMDHFAGALSSKVGKKEKLIRLSIKKQQSFTLMTYQPNWEGLDVFVDFQKTPLKGKIELLVFSKTGDQIRKSILDLSQTEGNSWLEFRFPPLTDSESKLFKLKLTIFNDGSKSPFCFFEIKTDFPYLKNLSYKFRAGGKEKVLFCNVCYA